MLRWIACRLKLCGGDIVRDPAGCINWQCRTCGRYADPVSKESERRMVDADIARHQAAKAAERDSTLPSDEAG